MPHTRWPRKRQQLCSSEVANSSEAANSSDAAQGSEALPEREPVFVPWKHKTGQRKRRTDSKTVDQAPEASIARRKTRRPHVAKKEKRKARKVAQLAATPAQHVPQGDARDHTASRLAAGRTENRLLKLINMHLFQPGEKREGDALQPHPGVFGYVDDTLVCILHKLSKRGLEYLDVVPLKALSEDQFIAKLDKVMTLRAAEVTGLNLSFEIQPQARKGIKSFRFRRRQTAQLEMAQFQALHTEARKESDHACVPASSGRQCHIWGYTVLFAGTRPTHRP